MAAAAFLILYMILGSPFLYQVLIVTHLLGVFPRKKTQTNGGPVDLPCSVDRPRIIERGGGVPPTLIRIPTKRGHPPMKMNQGFVNPRVPVEPTY